MSSPWHVTTRALRHTIGIQWFGKRGLRRARHHISRLPCSAQWQLFISRTPICGEETIEMPDDTLGTGRTILSARNLSNFLVQLHWSCMVNLKWGFNTTVWENRTESRKLLALALEGGISSGAINLHSICCHLVGINLFSPS